MTEKLKDSLEELKSDREMILASVKQDGDALHYVSDELRNDPEFLKMIKNK